MAFYCSFGYDLARSDFVKLIMLYAGLFFISYKLIQFHKADFWILAGIALLFRLVLFFAIPNLSQDFYRFIWDGRLVLEGLNPYLSTPNGLIKDSSFNGMTIVPEAKILLEGMGPLSAGNFTNYPPISQLCYAIAAWVGGKSILGNIIVMRVLIIAADIGTLVFGRKLLQKLNLPGHRIFWYVLNPLIIIELTGNLHFEGVMVFFLVWALYLLFCKKWVWAAVLFGLSVSVKLLPLLLLPLFFHYFKNQYFVGSGTFPPLGEMPEGQRGLGEMPEGQRGLETSQVSKTCEACGNWKKLVLFYAIVFATIVLAFLPFIEAGFLQNIWSSISLWFQKFEFNASIYYLIRWIGFQTVGWNIIGVVGKILPIIVFLIVLILSFFRKNQFPKTLLVSMMFAVCAYFFLSTTVHPWYLAVPLFLSVFTKYRFVLVWSFVGFFSYSAYGENGVDEELWLVALEYVGVFGVFLWEVFKKDEKT